ncbi:RIB43A-like with coiled-coils protein [Histomonas meleagridis]|uniref:RIB43A-like with coiled-coils protein 2 n=1 Tax=Histomonas meleagridis TaxID=135588 RepID=UPI00355A0ACC|nr:RIB43A-like with coiled-coils protein [Histomonas meleagridis]KAH0799747.1 RIB43A-like with coiled-coils protein 2 [Histomonas meleagridis]
MDTWVSPEDKEIMRANAMRKRMLDRKATLLDPQKRRIGIDVAAIQRQIQEKKEREAMEKARDEAFDQMVLEQQALVLEAQERERMQRRQIAEDDDLYRKNYQKPSQSREYDIWRKDIKRISKPARNPENESTLGPSSGQVFEGEDPGISQRLLKQAQQREEWHREQMREREAIKQKEQMEDLQYQLAELETQKKVLEYMEATERAKSEVDREIANENIRMMNEKKRREQEEREHEQQMNDAELRNNARSRTIMEVMSSRKDSPQEYRGMTIDEQKAVFDEQAKQIEEKKRIKNEEKERENQWDQYFEYLRQEGDRKEAEYLRRKQMEQKELFEFQKRQNEEFKKRQRYLNNVVYTNVPDDSYYNQWGHDTR